MTETVGRGERRKINIQHLKTGATLRIPRFKARPLVEEKGEYKYIDNTTFRKIRDKARLEAEAKAKAKAEAAAAKKAAESKDKKPGEKEGKKRGERKRRGKNKAKKNRR